MNMRTVLLTTCALSLMGGLAFAQGNTAPGNAQNMQHPAVQNRPAEPTTPAKQAGSAKTDNKTDDPAQGQTGSKAGQAGIRSVDPAMAVSMTYYAVQPADMRASKLIGTDVYNLNNENIGEVADLVIDNGSNIKAVVLSVGGFLGIGERNVAVQPGSVVLTEQTDGSARIVVNTTKDDLKNAPAFEFADGDRAGSGTAMTGNTGTSKSGAGTSGSTSTR